MNNLHFMLVADRYASRYLRRAMTAQGAHLGLLVGTFNELLEQARCAYLIGQPAIKWADKLIETAQQSKEAFWNKSLALYPKEAGRAIEQALTELLEGAFPEKLKVPDQSEGLSALAQGHLEDLVDLCSKLEQALPEHLATAASILACSGPPPWTKIRIYYNAALLDLKPWQSSLIEKINRDSALQVDDLFAALFAELSRPLSMQHTQQAAGIRQLATRLFQAVGDKVDFDDSLQWIAARDYLEEAEVVAGQIQGLLKSDQTLCPADLALLLPTDARYGLAVRDVFHQIGVPLSGVGGTASQRDPGREILFHFFMVMQKPAAVMAWAALLTSPFMPWSARLGHIMAQRVAEGRFAIEQMPLESGAGRALLELLKKNLKDATSREVLTELQAFAALLDFGDEKLADAEKIFAETLSRCLAQLNQAEKVDWDALRRTTTPEVLSVDWETTPNREGVAVFQESGEPWRRIKHLFVLGFGDGHYPRVAGYSPIFSDLDLKALNAGAGIAVATGHDLTAQNRQLFKRQLGSAAETITFLFSRKSPLGESLQISSTLPFMMKLFTWEKTAEQLVLEMDRREDRDHIRWLAESAALTPMPPRALALDDLELETDLLSIWPKADGSLREQSPSRLANLMTAPLAWLFDWIGIKPLEWQPETMDPATKGTLAHEVFEHLFLPDKALPTLEEIKLKVPPLLQNAIRNNVPFLQASEWNVERNHLESDILKAALQWQKLLKETGLRVIGNEIKLYGELDGVPLKGFADLILSLPDGRIIVGDYKKSKSAARRKQMAAGYDSQTSIYRSMLERGRISSKQEFVLPKDLSSDRIGVLYYTMNDQMVLTDTSAWLPVRPDIKELGGGIASGAMTDLRQRFKEARQGQVMLNSTPDEKDWDKLGVKLYCLDNSPLLRIFMHPEEVSS